MNRKRKASTSPAKVYSNAIPLAEVTKDTPEWIKIVPVGVFPLHPDGPHEITKDDIKEMAANFAKTNTDLLFDYEHRSLWGDSLAAGWSNEVEAREDGLYTKYPEFTATAQAHIEEREYRYLSPVYKLDALDKTGHEIGAVLVHVGLTNIPYMDNEVDHIGNSRKPQIQKQNDMKLTPENLKKLGLEETATEEEVNQVIANSKFVEAAEAKPANEEEDEDDETTVKAKEKELAQRLVKLERKLIERDTKELAEKAETLVNSAVQQGKILPAQKNVYLNAAKANYEDTKKELDAIKVNSNIPGGLIVSDRSDEEVKTNSESFAELVAAKTPNLAK